MCKAGRVKGRAIYKQTVSQTSTQAKPTKKKLKKVKTDQDSKDKMPKEIRECLICLKKVGTQVNVIHFKLHIILPTLAWL